MKRFILIGIACLTLAHAAAHAQMARFEGMWINVDPNTRGITALEITGPAAAVKLQVWGNCHPSDCDWGRITAYAYGPDVQANLANTAQAVTGVYKKNFAETIVAISPKGQDELLADSFTRFTDNSGRTNYASQGTFKRGERPGAEKKPDLVVKSVTLTWTGTAKKVRAVVANIGDADAGRFMVYFDGKENPVSNNRRPQVRSTVDDLARGATVTLDADFLPLAHPDNANLANVKKICVVADAKSEVREKKEDNNTQCKSVQ